ncbi:type II toxin-antitoxin system PemK/MazF family toxin [Castellaniella ginsengisoli]|uniref:Type II toxin-antitoxin system PemK/MazF family toxin n=1 Tax=Castellaniella ginsengisoli TaxID=546114 RepID=A0AB39D7Y0_9BURK
MVDQAKKDGALKLYLKTGEVVICNYDTGFIAPEMVKTRPVVVISKSSTHWRGLCTVVPLSTTPPEKVEAWHVSMQNVLRRLYPYSHPFGQAQEMWAKCDMIATVSFCRITRPHNKQDERRVYAPVRLSEADLDAVFVGVRSYLPSAK